MFQSSGIIVHFSLAFSAGYSVRRGDPYGVDYHTLDPIAKGVWDCFSDDVVRTVYVYIDAPTVCRAKHPPRDPLAHIVFAMPNRLSLQKAAFARVALVDRANLFRACQWFTCIASRPNAWHT